MATIARKSSTSGLSRLVGSATGLVGVLIGRYSACNVLSKADSATSRVVRVQCRDVFGRLADSRFNILVLH